MHTDYDVIIAGGGLAGLVSAIELSAAGSSVLLLEKKIYPYHKVCGEYISNEVLGYLQSLGFDPFALGASRISKLRISTPQGKNIHTQLDLGGFGISRYTMDHALSLLAIKNGAEVLTDTKVNDIRFADDVFTVDASAKSYTAKLVIGSYGKRDMLDKKLNRAFMQQHTGYTAVKYHVRLDYPKDEIGLDNFADGYCGISRIEDDKYCMCYLYRRGKNYHYKSIPEFEAAVLHKNPVLKKHFSIAEQLYDAPLAINEINFSPKTLVQDHILMCGDTAGLITPLCGNGMSMAITGAKMLTALIKQSKLLDKEVIPMQDRMQLEHAYRQQWDKAFKQRLAWGRAIQNWFGNPTLTGIFLRTVHSIPPLEKKLIRATHGAPLV